LLATAYLLIMLNLKLTTFLIAVLYLFNGITQPTHFTRSNHWKHQKKEIIFGVGASNFLGDLGGLNRQGTNFSPLDLEWSVTRPSGHLGFRYRLSQLWSTKSLLQYAILKGDDALTNEPFRRNRNLSFRTHLFEFSQHIEFNIYSDESFGKRHKIYGLKGLKNKNTLVYLFSGFSVFGFVPQGNADGGWTNLRPLNTEGQGLEGAPESYKLINYGIPLGIGYKLGFDAVWRLTLELTYTQTFTDYLDDVSGVYYNNEAIRDAYGNTAAFFADPSSGAFPGFTHEGEKRGDSAHDDGYIFFNFSFARNITYKRSRIKWKYKRRYKF